jgi:hypothetical protein
LEDTAVSGKALDSQKAVRVITELQTARREIALLMAKVAELERR